MFPSLKSSSTRGKDNGWWIHLDSWRPLTITHDLFIHSCHKIFFCWLVSSWISIWKINLLTIRNLWFSQLLFKANKLNTLVFLSLLLQWDHFRLRWLGPKHPNGRLYTGKLFNLYLGLFMQWRPIRDNHLTGMVKSGYQYSCRYQQLIGCCQVVQRTWNWVYFKQSGSYLNILVPFSTLRWRVTEIRAKGNRHEY